MAVTIKIWHDFDVNNGVDVDAKGTVAVAQRRLIEFST